MNESILTSVKKLVGGITADYDAFDQDIIIHINTVLGILIQMGIGTPGVFITDATTTWQDFLNEDDLINLPAVKSWVALKVRMIFDPPTTSSVSEAMKETLKELEWRIYIAKNYIGEI